MRIAIYIPPIDTYWWNFYIEIEGRLFNNIENATYNDKKDN